jgi:hypothetical protein
MSCSASLQGRILRIAIGSTKRGYHRQVPAALLHDLPRLQDRIDQLAGRIGGGVIPEDEIDEQHRELRVAGTSLLDDMFDFIK